MKMLSTFAAFILTVTVFAISCGGSESKKDYNKKPGNPFENEPVRIIVEDELSVYESQIYISKNIDGIYQLHIPVAYEKNNTITPDISFSVNTFNAPDEIVISGKKTPSINKATEEIIIDIGREIPPMEKAVDMILSYSFSWGSHDLSGKLSFFRIIPRIKTEILGSATLLEGDSTNYRIIVTNKQTAKAVSNAAVALTAYYKDEIISSGSGTSNASGSVVIPLDIPAEIDGKVTLETVATTDDGAFAVEANANCFRHEKIMLTTDKPVYQPGQTIHIRALALKIPHKIPLAKRAVTMEIIDPKGNKIFKKTGVTSAYGITSTSFKLARLVLTGHYTIRTVVGTETPIYSEKTVKVDNYVLPRFSIDFKADKSFYLPGETISGTIDSNYFYGKPVSGASVHISAKKFDIELDEFQTIDGVLDSKGNYQFNLQLPNYFTGSELEQGNAFIQLDITVKDSAGHEQSTSKKIKIVEQPVLITLIPEAGRIIPDVKQRFFLLLSDPSGAPVAGITSISTGKKDFDVTVPVPGIAIFDYTPTKDETVFTVSLSANNKIISKSFSFTRDQNHEFVFITTPRAIYKAGDTISVAALVSHSDDIESPVMLPDRIYLDVIQNNQVRLMKTVELEKGAALIDITTDETMTGPVELFAYYLTDDGNIIRDSRIVYIRKASNLSIEMTADKDIYRPREKAEITFSVTDLDGNPAESAIGVSIVDEAVFHVQEFKPGLEQTYFDLEENIMSPSYEIHGISSRDIMSKTPESEEKKEEIDKRTYAYFSSESENASYGVHEDNYTPVKNKHLSHAKKAVKATAQNLVEPYIENESQDCQSYPTESIEDLFKKYSSVDPWDNLMKIEFSFDYSEVHLKVYSAGPDEIADTDDDISINLKLCEQAWDAVEGGSGGSTPDASAETSDEDPYPDPPGNEGKKVRLWFPETLYVNPELKTDSAGTATVDLRMPDSITSWRVTTLANTLNGDLGSALHSLTVFQDFFVDIDFPATLTQNDEVHVPVGIYNYLEVPQTVTLTAQSEEWFEMIGSETIETTVPANSVSAVYFPVKVTKIGTHGLTVYADGTELSDAVKRTVKVLPAGVKKDASQSDILTKSTSATLTIPSHAVPESQDLFVKLYPGITAQAIEGLDSILRMPNGCFEQTSSATYPNILILQYMLSTGEITPEVELKARDYITQGYQRLLTFEVDGGGFEWFGKTPAHFVLTCFGMMEFIDMAMVHDVDPAIIERTAEWMASQQNSDGSFTPTTGGIPEGAINNFTNSLLRTTAYGVWALSRAEKENSAVDRGVTWLKNNLNEAQDNYTKAIVAIALATAGHAQDSVVTSFINDLLEDKIHDGKGGYYWEQTEKTETYSSGDNAIIETTALIGLLLIETNTQPDVITGIRDWLVRQKDSFGNWSTTQGTVLALRFLITSSDIQGEEVDATIAVSANGNTPVHVTIDPENSDVLRLIDFKEHLISGENSITFDFNGTGKMMYSAVATWYEETADIPNDNGPLTIEVTYDKTSLSVNDTVGVTVNIDNTSTDNLSVILASIGLPPGFDPLFSKLDKLIEQDGSPLQKYETTPRQLILYIREISAGKTISLSYDLVARYPIKADSGESSVNPYYNPQQKTQKDGTVLEVIE